MLTLTIKATGEQVEIESSDLDWLLTQPFPKQRYEYKNGQLVEYTHTSGLHWYVAKKWEVS